jgi:hypothetical protein
MVSDKIYNKEVLHAQIESCMQRLNRVFIQDDLRAKYGATDRFMNTLYDLYVDVQENPALKETAEYQKFLQESAPLVARAQDYIVQFKMDIEDFFRIDSCDSPYDPWPEVCWRRSAYEAFKELYQFTQETGLKEWLDLSFEDFDTEYIDDMIEATAYIADGVYLEPIHKEDIPAGIPRSHWWWWGEKSEDNLAA